MAGVLGFGIDADTVVAESLAPTPGYRLRGYGLPIEQLDVPQAALEADLGSGDTLKPDLLIASPEQLSSLILEQLDVLSESTPESSSPSLPPGSHAHFDVMTGDYNWSPTDGQTASMDIDFSVDVYATVDEFGQPDKKYMVVTPTGSGLNPGALRWDNDSDRGYFQEKVDVHVRPLHHRIQAKKHAPLTDNQTSSSTTSTNMSIGVTGSTPPSLSVGFQQGTSATVYHQDFGVSDQSVGRSSQWSFHMTAHADGGSYDEWDDLIDDGDLYELPELAKSTLTPQFETVYWTDDDFEGIAATRFEYKQTLRNTWLDFAVFNWVPDTKWKSVRRWIDFAVDFSAVQTAHQGTLRFDESWAGNPVPERWLAGVQESPWGTTNWQITAGDELLVTGNAYGSGPDGERRGSFIEAHSTSLETGSVAVRVWPADDDTFGVMYSMQDDSNYYRVEIDKEQNYARIIKVEDGVLTVLVSASAPAFALNQWHDLRIEREGTAHHLYFNDVKLTTGYDGTFGPGRIALYTWGMSTVYFGPVSVRRPYEPDHNLAYERPTWQSSTLFPANWAVDGITDYDFDYNYSSASITAYSSQPYWIVDLESTRVVNDVVLWGAYGGAFHIDLLDENLGLVKTTPEYGSSDDGESYSMDGAAGRFVRIQMYGTAQMKLGEVEVFGPVD